MASFCLRASSGEVDLRVDPVGVGLEDGLGGEFSSKGGVLGGAGEGEVELCGALAEDGGGGEVKAGVRGEFRRGELVGVGPGWEFRGRSGGGGGGYGFIEAGEFVKGKLPAVAFIGNLLLQHGRYGFAGLDGSEKSWDAGKMGDFGEEAADLDVGVEAGFEAAK